MKRLPDPTAGLSAKIKRTLIELHNYSFFHNPSEIGNVDERFTGRISLANKLKTILSNHETKSGSYLVTGYRGVGKSSLVAKVLSEISSGHTRSARRTRYLRILAPLLPLALIDFANKSPAWVTVLLPTLLIVFSLLYVVRTDTRRKDLDLGPISRRISSPVIRWIVRHIPDLPSILRTFLVDGARSPNLRFRAFVQDVYLVSLLHFVALGLFRGLHIEDFTTRFAVYLGLYTLLVVATSAASQYRYTYRRSQGTGDAWRRVGRQWLHAVRNYINYSHRVYIKINLGQDDLREIEILRLITTTIYGKYQAFKKVGFANMFWMSLLAFLVFFGVGTVYFYQPVYNLNVGLKTDSRLCLYLPTQGSFLLRNGTTDLDRILDAESDRSLDLERFAKQFDAMRRPEYAGISLAENLSPANGGAIRQAIVKGLAYGDIFAHLVYTRIRDHIPGMNWLRSRPINDISRYYILPVSDRFQLVPDQIDYLFILYFLLAGLVLRALSRMRIFGLVTHGLVLRRLEELNASITAQITEEHGATLNTGKPIFGFGFSRRRGRTSPIASLREIEKGLIEILDEIDRIPRFTVRPNFIFVFDELDKIEPHQNVTLSEREAEEMTGGSATERASSSYEAARERQQRILELLSNLKHFFTTARAKFIFIAGREMFDASLADVSDRHFFMGSIFNDVVNVPSFLRDPSDGRLADITSMTEFYVCRLLLPPSYKDSQVSLQTYNRYLQDNFFNDPESSALEIELAKRQRWKVIYDLKSFIVYLTYRSNGAPKKITRFLESYIKSPSRAELESPEYLVVGKCSSNLYLEFGYYDQYTFGLVTYLATPLFLSLNKAIKDFGDKLLVSTSFLLDHIYKFHGFGFSWRNLELIPEIVDINKAPELRQVIGNIVHFLTGAHIDEIVSGLYDFKFRKQVVEEISFLSKISEREAAAFNFTLDESLSLKRHYNRELRKLLAVYKPYSDTTKEANYIHSIGFLRMILGDLHFYDEEYDQAILEYMEAVQSVQNVKPEQLNVHRLVVVTRNLLRLGLAFERKKTFDSAFVTYGKLTSLIVQFRDIDLKTLGVDEVQTEAGIELEIKQDPKPDKQRWKREQFGELIDKLPFGAHREELAFKMSAFHGIRLLYQPLLAKLQIMEKANLGGITPSDLRTINEEFEFLVKLHDRQESFLIRAEFKEKVGDVLYYKNGREPEFSARIYYEDSLSDLLDHIAPDESGTSKTKVLERLLEAMEKGAVFRQPASTLKELAITLSDTGDSVLGSVEAATQIGISPDYLERVLALIPSGAVGWKKLPTEPADSLGPLELVFLYYIVSALFYKNAGEHRAYAFQLTKILYVIRESMTVHKTRYSDSFLKKLEKEVVSRAIRGVYRTYESTHRLEIESFQEIFETEESSAHHNHWVNLNNLSLSFDVREIVILYHEIELKAAIPELVSNPEKWIKPYLFNSSYSSINSIYNRIHELRYRGNVNYRMFETLDFKDLAEDMGFAKLADKLSAESTVEFCRRVFDTKEENITRLVMEFLITDSIFCFHEIVRSLRIYGISFMANHTMRAAAHEKLASWCSYYYAYLKSSEKTADRARIEKRMQALIGPADMVTITPNYHNELALVHYRAAIEVHREGKAYKEIIDKMFYLNDDFNDKLTHFCAALERYRVESPNITNKIAALSKKVEATAVYQQDRYYTGPESTPDRAGTVAAHS